MVNASIVITLLPVIAEQLANLQKIVAMLGQDDITEEQVNALLSRTGQVTDQMTAAVNQLKPKVGN